MHHDPRGLAVPDGLSGCADSALVFNGHDIRVFAAQDRKFLSALDICRALELPIGGKVTPGKYIRHIDNREKAHKPFPTPQGPQMSVGLTVAGALALASPPRRKRLVDEQFREWMMSAQPAMHSSA